MPAALSSPPPLAARLTRVHNGAVRGAQHQAAAVWDGVRDADGRALKGAQLEGLPHVDGVQPALIIQVELLLQEGIGGRDAATWVRCSAAAASAPRPQHDMPLVLPRQCL